MRRRGRLPTTRCWRHIVLASWLGLTGCDDRESTGPSQLDVQLRRTLETAGMRPVVRPPEPPAALVELGQALMFDKVLSGNRDVSCATCHDPTAGTGDRMSFSVGTGGSGRLAGRIPAPLGRFMARNSLPLMNLGFPETRGVLFWDGRVRGLFFPSALESPAGPELPPGLSGTLAAQALFPLVAREEMRGDRGVAPAGAPHNELAELDDTDFRGIWGAVMQRLLAIPEYVTLFQRAFPDVSTQQLGIQHVGNAIAAFQVGRWTKVDAPFDRYLAGNDAAMTSEAKRGALLFFGRARCTQCHFGPLFTSFQFVNTGIPPIGPGRAPDEPLDHGRERVSGVPFERFMFKTPSLRNVELTGPWMHNGAYTTLEAAVRHYSDVPSSLRNYDPSQLRADIQATHRADAATTEAILAGLDVRLLAPLALTDTEVLELVAFLRALTDPDARNLARDIPARVPSGLPVDR